MLSMIGKWMGVFVASALLFLWQEWYKKNSDIKILRKLICECRLNMKWHGALKIQNTITSDDNSKISLSS